MENNSGFKEGEEPVSSKMKKAKLKKAFGKAKLFEIRRIVRRIKQVSLKKGTAQQLAKNKRKVERLEQQLEFLKDTNFEAFIEAIETAEEIKTTSQVEEGQGSVKSLVMSKLLEIVRKSEATEKSQQKVTKRKKNSADKAQLLSNTTGHFNESDDFASESSQDELVLEQREIDSDREQSISDSEAFISQSTKQPTKDSMLISSFTNGKGKRDGRKKNETGKKKIDFLNDEVEFSSDGEETGNKPSLSLDSVFVGSLSSGKGKRDGSRKTDGKRKRDGKKNKKEIKKNTNRLGQRQRRQQWEKLYGRKANHLKSEPKNDSMNNKKRKMDIKNRNSSVLKKKTKEATDLHPSWEASKSKRKQESIVAFEGKKITFDD